MMMKDDGTICASITTGNADTRGGSIKDGWRAKADARYREQIERELETFCRSNLDAEIANLEAWHRQHNPPLWLALRREHHALMGKVRQR